ncbi:MAG: formylglycine-generating enzyme family protein [candidate division Zixibacteria bacterium]|nr:formylglycine-generating enzyme family protein [candidate division Zixibacteria bacterium]
MKQISKTLCVRAISWLLPVIAVAAGARGSDALEDTVSANMVLVEGGMFEMGDVFGEGRENERPVHQVTLSDFFISKYEVTVAQFRQFVEETGYRTSAEGLNDVDARGKIMKRFSSENLTVQERQKLHEEFLKHCGAGFWDAEKRQWTGYNPLTTWRNPGIEQTADNPVLAVSDDDAMQYCNWLSERAGLPVAYDLETGGILGEDGNPTDNVTSVKGYRLPTESEWEYAAREGGRRVRFGNGKDIAKSSEMNFRADDGEYEYLELGQYPKGTSPVGSYPPNSLGLYDMSGNAWEWVSDKFATYTNEARTNPYGTGARGHALRGGRWGGDASEARVFSRSSWVRNDRCNNSGFRIARSAN